MKAMDAKSAIAGFAAAASSESVSMEEFRGFAKLLGVYLNLDEQDREGVESMASIVVDPDATDDEIEAAIETLREGLFPTAPADLEAGWGEDADQESLSTQMDLEEVTFARHLERCMVAKGMTQVQLAAAIGVGQPAIS